MRFLQRPEVQAEKKAVEPPPVPGTPFEGSHCFREGFFYPVSVDADGNDLGPDTSRPLVYKGGTLLHAEPQDVSHFHEYGRNEKEIAPGESE